MSTFQANSQITTLKNACPLPFPRCHTRNGKMNLAFSFISFQFPDMFLSLKPYGCSILQSLSQTISLITANVGLKNLSWTCDPELDLGIHPGRESDNTLKTVIKLKEKWWRKWLHYYSLWWRKMQWLNFGIGFSLISRDWGSISSWLLALHETWKGDTSSLLINLYTSLFMD